MDGGLAAAAAAAAVDVSRVDAAEADATGPDASHADASRASSTSETVATCSGSETGFTAYQAAKLRESRRFHNEVVDLLKSILGALKENGALALVLAVLAAVLAALSLFVAVATLFGELFSDELHGKARVGFVAGMAGLTVVSICAAIWLFLRWKRRPRPATDVESGGRGWFCVCRYWDGVTKGSRIAVCIYYSTCGRYGSSRLGA
jgi:hypothetical protein